VARLSDTELQQITAEVTQCQQCPRLVKWCRTVAVEKRAAYRDDEYWGKPISGFGDERARIVVLGLAPGAQIEQGGCLPAIAVASGCSVQCIAPGLQTKQLPTIEKMG